jgi:hypothetical protein
VAVALLGLVAWLGHVMNPTTTSELDTLFRARVPAGSGMQQVVAFLDSLGVEHGKLDEERGIYAFWRGASHTLVSTTDIRARFYFDEHDRLIRYELEEFHTYL